MLVLQQTAMMYKPTRDVYKNCAICGKKYLGKQNSKYCRDCKVIKFSNPNYGKLD